MRKEKRKGGKRIGRGENSMIPMKSDSIRKNNNNMRIEKKEDRRRKEGGSKGDKSWGSNNMRIE